MKHRLLFTFVAAAIVALAPAIAYAALSQYAAVITSGSKITPATMNTLVSGSQGMRWSNFSRVYAVNLPFTFYFDGVAYSRVTFSTNGVMGLGTSNITTSSSNSLTTTSTIFPRIVPFWDLMQMPGSAGRYCSTAPQSTLKEGVTGTAPNRIWVADWNQHALGYYSLYFVSFQVRLYEGSNKIEFYYTDMSGCSGSSCWYGCGSSSATIGIARSSSDYISILPNGSSATVSRSSVYNSTNVRFNTITAGTVYAFQPCNIDLAGNTSQGGTTGMVSGDTLFRAFTVQRGNSEPFTPFSILNPTTGCGSRTYTVSVTGANAGDFQVANASGTINQGQTITPVITVTPGAIGLRTATLTVTDNNGFRRTYPIVYTATPRINWIPNLADGGTASLANGDTLMPDIVVPRRSFRDLLPIELENFNTNVSAPPALVTVSVDSFGTPSAQYSLQSAATTYLSAGQTYSPVIRFAGMGVGVQEARLIINADGEVRTFILRAVSGAPAIAVTVDGLKADEQNPVFNGINNCVGEVATTVPFAITNIGTMPLVINSMRFFVTDTVIRQGTPPVALVRDVFGNLVRSSDYVISVAPGVAPLSANTPVATPFTVEPKATTTLYLTYVGQRPGKRFGRVYLSTNAENIIGRDTDSNSVEGVLSIDLLARAVGTQLAGDQTGAGLRSLVLPHTHVRDTSFASFTIANTGACDLRIDRDAFRISSGDVNEFALMSVLTNTPTDANGDYLIPPGSVDSVVVRFIPTRSGSRTVTIRLQTNDSLIGIDGVTEKGSRYLDIHGRGIAGLDTRELVLDPVVIGNSVAGTVTFENSSTGAEQVNWIFFMDGQAAEFSVDNMPTLPTSVLPGAKLNLTVRLTPVGEVGERRTFLVLVTNTGDTIAALVRGEAGTQQLSVNPSSLFDNVAIGVGQAVRGNVIIANNGTLPLRLTSVEINGADAANYRMGVLPRMDIEAGATEYLELTFAPQAQGESSAQLDVLSGGVTYSVALGGTALRIKAGDPTTGAISGRDGIEYTIPDLSNGTASSDASVALEGVTMMATRPNPATSTATIEFVLASRSDVRVEIFDARGELVRTLVNDARAAGRHSVTADLTTLPEGTYRATLSAGRNRLSQSLVIVR